ncbi:MAG: hypothetical protein ACRD5I_08060 [Candidatus Acidiferrales bacterium]
MLTKKLAVVVALTVLALMAPAAYADGGETDENTSDPAAVQESAGASATNVVTGRQASTPLWSPVRMSRSASGFSGSASSASVPPPVTAEDEWEIILAPYLYLASLNGDMGVGRATSVPLDVRAGTILENFQFGFMGRFEVRKGRWGGMFEASYIELGASIPMAGAIIGTERVTDAEFEQTMLEGFLTYRVHRSDKTAVDLFGGFRYWDMDIDLQVTGPLVTEDLTRGERWADPVFGVRVIHFISDRWFIPVRGDLGGFGGVGATSDFTWNIQGGIGFQANKHMFLVIQYKAIGVDFDNEKQGTPDFFAFDAVTHGPVIGLGLRFGR